MTQSWENGQWFSHFCIQPVTLCPFTFVKAIRGCPSSPSNSFGDHSNHSSASRLAKSSFIPSSTVYPFCSPPHPPASPSFHFLKLSYQTFQCVFVPKNILTSISGHLNNLLLDPLDPSWTKWKPSLKKMLPLPRSAGRRETCRLAVGT
jgi:hypothetical protein